MEVPENESYDVSNWKEVIAHREETYLEGIDVFRHHLVLTERSNALIHLRVINQRNQEEHYLNFGEPAYDAGVGYNPDFDTNILRFHYTSLTTPSSVFDYNMDTKDKTLIS